MIKRIFKSLALILVFSCNGYPQEELNPTRNKGGYTFSKMEVEEDLQVSGFVLDLETKEPLTEAFIVDGCFKTKTDSTGHYAMSFKNSDMDLYLKCSFIGYYPIETKDFNLKNSALEIDFYLSPDDRPLIDCMKVPD